MTEAIALLIWIAAHAASLVLILFIAFALGDVFLRPLPFASFLERAVMTIAIGLGLCALVLLVLGVLGLLSKPLVLAATGLAGLAALWRILAQVRTLKVPHISAQLRDLTQWQFVLLVGLVGYWALLILPSLYPPVQWDATAYHLVLARQYLETHQIRPDTGVPWPILPVLNQLLFSWAMAVMDDVLAQLVEHAFLMLSAFGLYAWGKRSGEPLLGLAAAVVWVSHPLVRWLGAIAYVDVALTSYTFLAIYASRVCWQQRDHRFCLLGLALSGMAAGTKTTGLTVFCLTIAFSLIAANRFGWGRSQLIKGLGVCTVVAFPWYLLIGVFTGNPIWPLFPQYSQGIWADPRVINHLNTLWQGGLPKTPLNYFLLPVVLVWRSDAFRADNGLNLVPLLAAFPICWLVALKDQSVRWWTIWSGAIMLAWFVSSQQVRLLLPALPMMGLAVLESLQWISVRLGAPSGSLRRMYAVMIVSATLVGGGVMSYQAWKRGTVPRRSEQKEAWRMRTVAGYRAVQFLNQRARSEDTVYLINVNWLAYHCRPRTRSMDSSLEKALIPSADPWPSPGWSTRLKSEGVGWIVLNHTGFTESSAPGSQLPRLFSPDYQLVYEDEEACVFRLVDR